MTAFLTVGPVRSYRTLSAFPQTRCGSLLSVALSLTSPSPGVTRHPASLEPGLSSMIETTAAAQPSDKA